MDSRLRGNDGRSRHLPFIAQLSRRQARRAESNISVKKASQGMLGVRVGRSPKKAAMIRPLAIRAAQAKPKAAP